MATRTFEDVYDQAMKYYEEHDYARALDVMTREGVAFPEEEYQVFYLRSCFAARIGQTDLALSLMQEALDRGMWYNDQVLRKSPSWQVLQGMPEFEKIAVICAEREAAARGEPELFVLEPERGLEEGKKYPLLIALHGNAANGPQAMNGWRPVLDEGWILAAPQSSQVVTANTYIWDDQEFAMKELAAHYAHLCSAYPVDTDRVVIAGFSMGGETALRAVLEGIIPVKGFILLGPGGPVLDEPDGWLPLLSEGRARGVRGYILMGDNDRLILPESLMKVASMLNSHGIPCETETLQGMKHAYPQDFAPIIKRALEFIF